MELKEGKRNTRPSDDKGLDDSEEVEEMEQGIVEEQLQQKESNEKAAEEDTNNHQPQVDIDSAPESTCHRLCSQLCVWPRVLVIGIHIVFIMASGLMETDLTFAWADEAAGVTWLAATNQSVIQHLKMMLWPWWLILWPMDLLARKYWYGRNLTLYQRRISQSTWLSLCLAQPVAMLSAMLFIAVVYAIIHHPASESSEPVAIAMFLVAVIFFPTLRLYWMGNEKVAAWWAFGYLMFGILWFYTYFSYEEDICDGFWFDPHDPKGDDSTDGE